MKPSELFKEMQNKIDELVNSSPLNEVQSNIKSAMNNTFSKLDLITREEFDIQKEVLQTTRAKLETLEQQLQHLSSILENHKH